MSAERVDQLKEKACNVISYPFSGLDKLVLHPKNMTPPAELIVQTDRRCWSNLLRDLHSWFCLGQEVLGPIGF